MSFLTLVEALFLQCVAAVAWKIFFEQRRSRQQQARILLIFLVLEAKDLQKKTVAPPRGFCWLLMYEQGQHKSFDLTLGGVGYEVSFAIYAIHSTFQVVIAERASSVYTVTWGWVKKRVLYLKDPIGKRKNRPKPVVP